MANSKTKVAAPKQAQAVLRALRTSPIKLNQVAALIRGMRASEALAQLAFNQRRISNDVRKCLQSAIANAENNHGMDVDALVVSEAFVGKNLVMKRVHARARGRAARVLKPFSNLTIILREQN
jgi:large subunit ribosomal protein L22